MPTYGYECLDCANSFETFQKITDDSLTQCDTCGGVLRKKIFPVGIVFKGSGFYVNDYANKAKATEEAPPVKAEAPAAEAPKETAESGTPAPAPDKTPEPKPADATPAAASPAPAAVAKSGNPTP